MVLYMFMFVAKSVIEMFKLQGWISELGFRIHCRNGRICEMNSDIPKLYEIMEEGGFGTKTS